MTRIHTHAETTRGRAPASPRPFLLLAAAFAMALAAFALMSLDATPADALPPASSCNGVDACSGVTGPIGENSCNADRACVNAGPVGDNSCNAVMACEDATGPIGNDSCVGFEACRTFAGATNGSVGNGSCNAAEACRAWAGATSGDVGDNSCNGSIACGVDEGATLGDVGLNSCNGTSNACRSLLGAVSGSIGNNSCNGDSLSCATGSSAVSGSVGNNSCNSNLVAACWTQDGAAFGDVGENSCNAIAACLTYNGAASGDVGDESCNALLACSTNSGATSGDVGDNSCNTVETDCQNVIDGIGDCEFNDVEPAACVNTPPTANDDAASTTARTAVIIDVTDNDTDVDNDPLTIDSVTYAGTGTVSAGPDGTITYTPAGDFVGSESFTYTIGDGRGGADTATVTVDVRYDFGGFLAPVATDMVVNVVKAGRSIPIKFSLGGDFGLEVLADGSPSWSPVVEGCDGESSDVGAEAVTAGNSELRYDSDADIYVYVWKTDKSMARTCVDLALTLDDGSVPQVARFEFK